MNRGGGGGLSTVCSTTQAAILVGVDRRQMRRLCLAAGIVRKPNPSNGKARCLTAADVATLRRFLAALEAKAAAEAN